MSWVPALHNSYVWQDAPSTATSLSAAHLMAAEDDIVAYVQATSIAYDFYAQGVFLQPDTDIFVKPDSVLVYHIGDLKASAASAPPDAWLACDGSELSRDTYADLYAAIGTNYGVGDGGSTFNIPDYRGRSVLGAGAGPGLTTRIRGDKGGAETHTHPVPSLNVPAMTASGQSVSVSVSAHAHTLSDAGGAKVWSTYENIIFGTPGFDSAVAPTGPNVTFSGVHYISGGGTAGGFFNGSGYPRTVHSAGLLGNTDAGGSGAAGGSTGGGTAGPGATTIGATDPGSSMDPYAVANVFIYTGVVSAPEPD